MDREAFDRKYTRRLNPQQTEAVHAVDGAVLLLAVPGSGKTTVMRKPNSSPPTSVIG